MVVETRAATAEDAAFLAWVMQEAGRSHLERGIWDVMLPGDDAPRLDFVAELATSETLHFCHWSRFRVALVDGKAAAALSAYENAELGAARLNAGMLEVFAARGWTGEEMKALGERIAPFSSTGYVNRDGVWIIEWVATLPVFRGRGLVARLLDEILEVGRSQDFRESQIGYLIGNTPARRVYEKKGFETVKEYCHPDFEVAFGCPGVASMQLDL